MSRCRRQDKYVLCARSTGVEDLHREELDLLGNAVEKGTDCAGHVRSMSGAIRVVSITDSVVEPSRATFELLCYGRISSGLALGAQDLWLTEWLT